MTFILRRIIWDDGRPSIDPEDYQVIKNGEDVGRMYRTKVPAGVRWVWTIYGTSISGVEETREAAMAVWKAEWQGTPKGT
jgi:hypothetical protein